MVSKASNRTGPVYSGDIEDRFYIDGASIDGHHDHDDNVVGVGQDFQCLMTSDQERIICQCDGTRNRLKACLDLNEGLLGNAIYANCARMGLSAQSTTASDTRDIIGDIPDCLLEDL